MNNLIEKLKEEATYNVLGVKQVDQQKFAELLLQEFIETLGTYEDYTPHKEQMSMLKKQFGVE